MRTYIDIHLEHDFQNVKRRFMVIHKHFQSQIMRTRERSLLNNSERRDASVEFPPVDVDPHSFAPSNCDMHFLCSHTSPNNSIQYLQFLDDIQGDAKNTHA